MFRLHPVARLLSALIIVVAVFASGNLAALGLVYMYVIVAVLAADVVVSHAKFAVFISFPILLALLLVWGWAVNPDKVPLPHASGISYAIFCWLRIVACGGVLQALFLPLVEKPSHLTTFLKATGMSGPLGTLIVSAIVFIPEIKHRLDRIIDARRAQGHEVSGIRGIMQLPGMLMPLVSSLLDSASKRAELWSHRGVLDRYSRSPVAVSYSQLQTAVVLAMAFTALAVGIWK